MLLVLNTGSSSIKAAVFDEELTEIVSGQIAGLGGGDNAATISMAGEKREVAAETHGHGIVALLSELSDHGISPDLLDAAAHRVVHGGRSLTDAVQITDEVLEAIERNVPLAPLHNPPALAGIRAMATAQPDLPQFASFDTAFHATQPALATTYAIPAEWQDKGLRRYGFHGLSYDGLTRSLREAGTLPGRLLALHLGAGCSLCAIQDGRSVATSMGYSPLTGPTMATRAGDIDGMAVLRMAEEVGADETARILNLESGLTALGGTPDMRELLDTDSDAARFAVDHFVWTVAHQAGGLIADMGGVDAVAFTGGIGENSAPIRDRIMDRLAFLGDLPVHIIPAEEEKVIARNAYALLGAG